MYFLTLSADSHTFQTNRNGFGPNALRLFNENADANHRHRK